MPSSLERSAEAIMRQSILLSLNRFTNNPFWQLATFEIDSPSTFGVWLDIAIRSRQLKLIIEAT